MRRSPVCIILPVAAPSAAPPRLGRERSGAVRSIAEAVKEMGLKPEDVIDREYTCKLMYRIRDQR